jgi:hypothetical protein
MEPLGLGAAEPALGMVEGGCVMDLEPPESRPDSSDDPQPTTPHISTMDNALTRIKTS